MKTFILTTFAVLVCFAFEAHFASAGTIWMSRVECDGNALVIDEGYTNRGSVGPTPWQMVVNDKNIADFFFNNGNAPSLQDGKLIVLGNGDGMGTRDGVWNFDFEVTTHPGNDYRNFKVFSFRFIPSDSGGDLYAWIGTDHAYDHSWHFQNCQVQYSGFSILP